MIKKEYAIHHFKKATFFDCANVTTKVSLCYVRLGRKIFKKSSDTLIIMIIVVKVQKGKPYTVQYYGPVLIHPAIVQICSAEE